MSLLLADCVEKLICASERERLIQDQVPARNNDSRTGPHRFFYCKFRLHSARSATFSTQSALSRQRRTGRACPLCPGRSGINLFRYRECIVDFDAEIADGALDLGVAEQELHGSQVAGAPVDQGRLCPPQRMRLE